MSAKFGRWAPLAPAMLLICSPLPAADWRLDGAESHLYFEYVDSGREWRGEFRDFDASFALDPDNPGDCRFDVAVQIDSLATGDQDTDDELKGPDMFDVEQWPQSSFQAVNCAARPDGGYVAAGRLTIRDVTNDLEFPFMLEIMETSGPGRFHMTSEVTIHRLEYGVGQGYWETTDRVADPVDVIVDVVANRTGD